MDPKPDQLKIISEMRQMEHELRILVTTPGWKHVREEFQRAADHAYRQMMETDVAHKSHVYSGVWHASKNIIEYPERTVEVLVRQIKALEASIKQG